MPFLILEDAGWWYYECFFWLKSEFSDENAVASSKNNAGASELVFGDEILDGLKVVGLQMILIGLR